VRKDLSWSDQACEGTRRSLSCPYEFYWKFTCDVSCNTNWFSEPCFGQSIAMPSILWVSLMYIHPWRECSCFSYELFIAVFCCLFQSWVASSGTRISVDNAVHLFPMRKCRVSTLLKFLGLFAHSCPFRFSCFKWFYNIIFITLCVQDEVTLDNLALEHLRVHSYSLVRTYSWPLLLKFTDVCGLMRWNA